MTPPYGKSYIALLCDTQMYVILIKVLSMTYIACKTSEVIIRKAKKTRVL